VTRLDEALTVIEEALGAAVRPCVTSSFQVDCVVLLHLIRQVAPATPVLFLETHHHFVETLSYRDWLAREWSLNLTIVQATEPSLGLWRESLDACCKRHKVDPLFGALERNDLWLTALRREQSASRAGLEIKERFPLPSGTVLDKVNPLALWTDGEVQSYAEAHAIPLLPLYARGYGSIGCEPCTFLPQAGAGARSGRWLGRKLECGIHVPHRPKAVAP
jgi:phosphoadenosine phosphosulfate reductase